MAKQFKSDIKYSITLDDEQKNVKKSIFENQIVIVTGRAGCLSYGTKVLITHRPLKTAMRLSEILLTASCITN